MDQDHKHHPKGWRQVLSWLGVASTSSLVDPPAGTHAPSSLPASVIESLDEFGADSVSSSAPSLYESGYASPTPQPPRFTDAEDQWPLDHAIDSDIPPFPPVTIKYRCHAKEVYITGDFDHWTVSMPMTKQVVDDQGMATFQATLHLDPTLNHAYKFVVDGQWLYDAAKPHHQDGQGNFNNVLHATQ
ncbi:immunoglobulin E-set [Gongronella butleri]|nr:immunoglobulin E-set [Gongronella butleri]